MPGKTAVCLLCKKLELCSTEHSSEVKMSEESPINRAASWVFFFLLFNIHLDKRGISLDKFEFLLG